MSLTLAAAETIQAVANVGASITFSVFGDEISGTPSVDNFHVLAQGQVASSVGAIYTAPASTQTLVKLLNFANATAGIVTLTVYVNGTAAANQVGRMSVPANGTATLADEGWKVTDANGSLVTTAVLATGAAKNYSARAFSRLTWR